MVLTSTHRWRAKSSPHPCTKSFCKFFRFSFQKFIGQGEEKVIWGLPCFKKITLTLRKWNLYHMPNTAPCFSRKYRSHDFYKTVQQGNIKVSPCIFKRKYTLEEGTKGEVCTLHREANGGRNTNPASPLLSWNGTIYIRHITQISFNMYSTSARLI